MIPDNNPVMIDVTDYLADVLNKHGIPEGLYFAVLDLAIRHSAVVTIHEDSTIRIQASKALPIG